MREKTTRSYAYGTEVSQQNYDERYKKAIAETQEAHLKFLLGLISSEECSKLYSEIFERYGSGVLADMRQRAERLSRE